MIQKCKTPIYHCTIKFFEKVTKESAIKIVSETVKGLDYEW